MDLLTGLLVIFVLSLGMKIPHNKLEEIRFNQRMEARITKSEDS